MQFTQETHSIMEANICIVTGIFPPDIGGPASYVPKIAADLTSQGHSIKVVCFSDSLNHNDIEKYPFKVVRIPRKLFKPWRFVITIFTICKLAKDVDLLYVNGLSLESMLSSWIVKVPTLHKIVGDYAWERSQLWNYFQGTLDEYQVADKGFLLKALDWIRSTPLKYTQKIIVPSIYLQKIVEGWGIKSDKISVVYNAIQIPKETESITLPSFGGKTILTVGRLVPWKGIGGLIEILLHFPEVRLVIVGEGPLRKNLEDLASRLGVDDRVLFMGGLSKSQVFTCLNQADIFVLNSSYEGLPHVILEAMTVGIPIIATDAGGTKEVVNNEKTGLLIPVGDSEALQIAINRLLSDPELVQNLVLNAKKYSESSFSYSAMMEGLEKTLFSIITNG